MNNIIHIIRHTARAATALAQAARRATAALAIILLTATTAWAQDAITGLTYNTAGGYYEISDAQDLVDLANYVNATENISIGKTFKQTQDIDMSSISNFTPIGELGGSYSFAGTYDGGGHTISGLTVSIDYGSIGLFGTIKGATVRNVILLSPTAKATTTINFSVDLGALIGTCNSGSSNRVENCHVVNPTVSSSSTSSKNYVGAIIGNIWDTNTTATNCYYYGGNATAACGYIEYGAPVTRVCAAHLVTPSDGVTIQTAMAPALGFTCDTDGDGNAENYWRSGAVLTLGYTGTAPDGYIVSGYTATNGTVGGNANDGYTLTMPNADVTVTATFSTPDPNDFSQSGDTYTINTATGWNVFCDLLAQHAKGYFSGKTVELGADITVTRMAGGQPFTGTFDGQNHKLTLAYGTADAPIDAQFVAPFVETSADGDHQPTFCNLTIDGTIYATHTQATDHDHVGGLIGHLFGTVTIEHCTSLVEIHAKVGAGGFVGLCEHSVSFNDCHSAAVIRSADGSNSGFVAWSRDSKWNINFTGCLFDGKLLQQNGTGHSNGGFIGWKGDAKTVNITNCLCAPAPLADGETMAKDGSATFSREHSDHPATIKNSYYTAAFEIAQGKAITTHTVTAGADVTIGGIALTGDATQYTVSGITAYSGGGLQRGQTLYYGSGDQLSLTLSNSVTGAPQGYQYGYTASAGTLSGTTLTMPDENVTISVNTAALLSDGQQHEVSYMTADGTTQTAQAVALDGHEAAVKEYDIYRIHLAVGTYYVGTDITYANQIVPDGDVTLILADGKTMTLASDVRGIEGDYDLTIYGQSLDDDAGTLRYNGTSEGIWVKNYVQHSGNVSITTNGSLVTGIIAAVTLRGGLLTISANGTDTRAIQGSMLSILGGHLTATGATGIYATGSSGITLGWTNPADFITASSYYAPGTVKVADGQALTDGSGHIYTGTLTAADLTAIGGQTLQPALLLADNADNTAAITDHAGKTLAVALSGRTLYKDGSWNTLCLPFDISTASGTLSGNNVQAMTLNTASSNFADGTLTLNFDDATGETIAAGTPFIIKWDESGTDIENPVFMGVNVSNTTNDATVEGVLTFTGTYAPVSIGSEGDKTKLYLGSSNTLHYPNGKMTIGTHRAYFQLAEGITAGEPAGGIEQGDDVEDGVRAFVLNFGDDEASGITEAEANSSLFTLHSSLQDWYTLDGRRLDGVPTAKGLYINKGKKVIVK